MPFRRQSADTNLVCAREMFSDELPRDVSLALLLAEERGEKRKDRTGFDGDGGLDSLPSRSPDETADRWNTKVTRQRERDLQTLSATYG